MDHTHSLKQKLYRIQIDDYEAVNKNCWCGFFIFLYKTEITIHRKYHLLLSHLAAKQTKNKKQTKNPPPINISTSKILLQQQQRERTEE